MSDLETEIALDAGVDALLAYCTDMQIESSNEGKTTIRTFEFDKAREIVLSVLTTTSLAIANHRAYLESKGETKQ